MPERFPQFFRDVRHKRLKQPHDGLKRQPQRRRGLGRLRYARERIGQFHNRRDGRVELPRLLDVLGHLADGLVGLAPQPFLGIPQVRPVAGVSPRQVRDGLLCLAHLPPHTLQEPACPDDGVILPLGVALGRADEERVQPLRVGAVLVDDGVGGDDVALGLRHLLQFAGYLGLFADHALREEGLERLIKPHAAGVVEDLADEACIQQVEDSVLHAPNILIHGHPVIDLIAVERLGVRLPLGVGHGEPQKIPARA